MAATTRHSFRFKGTMITPLSFSLSACLSVYLCAHTLIWFHLLLFCPPTLLQTEHTDCVFKQNQWEITCKSTCICVCVCVCVRVWICTRLLPVYFSTMITCDSCVVTSLWMLSLQVCARSSSVHVPWRLFLFIWSCVCVCVQGCPVWFSPSIVCLAKIAHNVITVVHLS